MTECFKSIPRLEMINIFSEWVMFIRLFLTKLQQNQLFGNYSRLRNGFFRSPPHYLENYEQLSPYNGPTRQHVQKTHKVDGGEIFLVEKLFPFSQKKNTPQ